MSKGYSRRPLAQKLGIKESQKVAFLSAPYGYDILLGALPSHVIITHKMGEEELDFIQLFSRDRKSLERDFPRLKRKIKQDGMIWITWPKGSSELRTDLSEGAVREVGLKNGLVDVKICSVDETWSALKFVNRMRDRR